VNVSPHGLVATFFSCLFFYGTPTPTLLFFCVVFLFAFFPSSRPHVRRANPQSSVFCNQTSAFFIVTFFLPFLVFPTSRPTGPPVSFLFCLYLLPKALTFTVSHFFVLTEVHSQYFDLARFFFVPGLRPTLIHPPCSYTHHSVVVRACKI